MDELGVVARRHARWIVLTVLALSSAGASGCGDDDTGDDDAGAVDGGDSGKGGGGTGDTDGGGGIGSGGIGVGSGGTGSGGMRAPVVCGGTMCTVPGGSTLQACCIDDECGLGIQGECQEPGQPGDPDSTCPSHETPSGSTLPGCCKSDNMCGVMSQAGLGCVERTELAEYAGGPLDELECGTTSEDGGDSDGGQ